MFTHVRRARAETNACVAEARTHEGWLGTFERADAEGDVESFVEQRDAAPRENDAHVDSRKALGVGDDDAADEGVAEDGVGRDSERAARRGIGVAHVAIRFFGADDEMRAPRRVSGARDRRPKTARRAVKEPDTERSLEIGDAAAERLLRDGENCAPRP